MGLGWVWVWVWVGFGVRVRVWVWVWVSWWLTAKVSTTTKEPTQSMRNICREG